MRRPLAIAAAFFIALVFGVKPALAEGILRTVLVIDASSSMRSTDPKEIRKVAAELFVDLTRDGDQLAVTGFDGAARESMGAFTTIRGPADREAVKRAVRAVGNDGSWTDFTAGLGEAKRLLDAAPDEPGDQELIVFLTDGRCEPDPKGAFAEQIRTTGGGRRMEEVCQDKVLRELLPSLGRTRVYAIGLSKAAPKAFIESVGVQSGGVGLATDRADDLPRLFADVYARLLGSKLTGGDSAPLTEFDVAEGVLTVDVVLAGPPTLTAKLTGPAGADVPLDNSDPAKAYFANNAGYRLIKVKNPAPGRYKLAAGGSGKGGKYAVLQNMDLNLEFIGLPEVFEVGKERSVRLRLATPGGKVPPGDFLDRHEMSLRIAEAPAKCLDALRGGGAGGPPATKLRRNPEGIYKVALKPANRGEICFEARMSPGTSGVLSRLTWAPVRRVVPPLSLKASATSFGEVKQEAKGTARISFDGSEIGEAIEVELVIEQDSKLLAITPRSASLTPAAAQPMDLVVEVSRDAKPGPREMAAVVRPVKPTGYEDRAAPVKLSITVVPLTFWERYGAWVKVGAGALLGLFLLIGLIAPARFRKGSVLHYKDNRDPDLPREGSYPLAAKAKAGFYKRARVMVAASGPVRMGGVVEIFAGPGGGALAKPLGGRKARELPRDEYEGGMGAGGEGREVPLKDGMFRVASGVKYEIEGSGLSFWLTLR